jgi:hypothetical protein
MTPRTAAVTAASSSSGRLIAGTAQIYNPATFVQQGRGARRACSGRRRSDELQPVEPEPGAQSRWVKRLSCYERRETTIVEGLRYG